MSRSLLFWRTLTHPLLLVPAAVAVALLLALAPLRVLVILVALIGAGALAWVGPIWAVYAAILSVPIQQMVLLPGGTSFTQAAVVLMAGAWVFRSLAQHNQPIYTGQLFWAWLALLGALLLATSFTPYSLSESLKASLRWIVAFLVWFVAVNSVTRRWHLAGLVACVLLAPAAEALIGLFQFASGSGPPSFRITESLPFVRAYGTIGQPNSFAGYMNMAWPLALALGVGSVISNPKSILATKALKSSLYHQNIKTPSEKETASLQSEPNFSSNLGVLMPWRLFPKQQLGQLAFGKVGLAVLLVAALAVSFSLGGWVGAVCGAVGLLAALGRRWAVVALGGAALLLGFFAVGGANLLPEAVGGRVSRLTGMLSLFDPATVTVTPANFALVERMAQMKAGWLMLLAHPLLGVGPGAYTLAYGDVASAPWLASRGHAHNFYLHMATEAGIIGCIAYLALIITSLILAVRALRTHHSPFGRSLSIGCCGIIAAVAGHNLFENLHVLNLGVQLSGVWAIVTLLARSEKSVLLTRD